MTARRPAPFYQSCIAAVLVAVYITAVIAGAWFLPAFVVDVWAP